MYLSNVNNVNEDPKERDIYMSTNVKHNKCNNRRDFPFLLFL